MPRTHVQPYGGPLHRSSEPSRLLHFPAPVPQMDIYKAIAELRSERELIDQAINALEVLNERRRPDGKRINKTASEQDAPDS